jgi:hypothetical protein
MFKFLELPKKASEVVFGQGFQVKYLKLLTVNAYHDPS